MEAHRYHRVRGTHLAHQRQPEAGSLVTVFLEIHTPSPGR